MGKGFAKVTISINLGDKIQKQVTISTKVPVDDKDQNYKMKIIV